MTILRQDYKNWKLARKEFKKAKTDLDAYYQSIIKDVKLPEYIWNIKVMNLFIESMPKDEGQPDFKEKFVAEYEMHSSIWHAKSCFYRLRDKMYAGTLFEQDLSLKEVQRCMNNHEDGTIHEFACCTCQHFKELVQYQMLIADVAEAKQKRENARKQFFSHFWKQNTKGK